MVLFFLNDLGQLSPINSGLSKHGVSEWSGLRMIDSFLRVNSDRFRSDLKLSSRSNKLISS